MRVALIASTGFVGARSKTRCVLRSMIAAWCACAACDQVFDLDPVIERPIDASGFDATRFDTSGWPTNGNIDPKVCPPSGADEDTDGKLDDCDNCPADANDQADRDRDGVGDACDRHPDFAVERLALFLSFNDPANPGGTPVPNTGVWVVENGALHQRGTGIVRAAWQVAGTFKRPTVTMKAANWQANGATTQNWYVGLEVVDSMVADMLQMPERVDCRGHFGTSRGSLEMVRFEAGVNVVSTDAAFALANPVLTIAQTSARHGAPPQCDGERGDLPFPPLHHLVLAVDPNDVDYPVLRVFTYAARADFRSIVVYETIVD